MDNQKPVKVTDIIEKMAGLIEGSLGNTDLELLNFATAESAHSTSFGFVNNDKNLTKAAESSLGCVLAPQGLREKVERLQSSKTWLFAKNVDLAAREIKKNFFFETPYRAPIDGVHGTAIIGESAQIAADVVIGPHAVIGENVKIGGGSFVGANTVIEENCEIGEGVTLHPLVYIGHGTQIGNHCEVMPNTTIGSEGFGYAHDHLGNHYRVPHTGRVILEDDVHVGAGVSIDRGTIEDTRVGRGTKLDNLIHLAHNTIIGKNGLLTAQVATAGSSTIGDNFICGGHTAITGHIKITDNVHIGGFSGITKSVTEPGPYQGYPLQPLQQHLKTKASTVHLPELRKQMNRVLRKLFPEDFN